jgi:maltose O-acetyltransferase
MILVNKRKEKILRFVFRSIPVHIIMLLTALLPNSKPANRIRGFLLRPFFKSAGKNLQIASGVIINLISNISVGNNVYIAHNVWINGAGGLVLEDGVIIGPFSVIVTTMHMYGNDGFSNEQSIIAPIKICKGSWISSHVVINSGVEIGEKSVVAAGAVVTKNVGNNTMVGGVPAKFIKNI